MLARRRDSRAGINSLNRAVILSNSSILNKATHSNSTRNNSNTRSSNIPNKAIRSSSTRNNSNIRSNNISNPTRITAELKHRRLGVAGDAIKLLLFATV